MSIFYYIDLNKVHLRTESSCEDCTHECGMTIEQKLFSLVDKKSIEDLNLRFRFFDTSSINEPSYKTNHFIYGLEGIKLAAKFISKNLVHHCHVRHTKRTLKQLNNLDGFNDDMILFEEGL